MGKNLKKNAESLQEVLRNAVENINEETGEIEPKLVQFTYENKTGKKIGQRTIRKGEPYKLSEGFLFLFDLGRKDIRKFYLTGIRDLKVLDETFNPRWDIEI